MRRACLQLILAMMSHSHRGEYCCFLRILRLPGCTRWPSGFSYSSKGTTSTCAVATGESQRCHCNGPDGTCFPGFLLHCMTKERRERAYKTQARHTCCRSHAWRQHTRAGTSQSSKHARKAYVALVLRHVEDHDSGPQSEQRVVLPETHARPWVKLRKAVPHPAFSAPVLAPKKNATQTADTGPPASMQTTRQSTSTSP